MFVVQLELKLLIISQSSLPQVGILRENVQKIQIPHICCVRDRITPPPIPAYWCEEHKRKKIDAVDW